MFNNRCPIIENIRIYVIGFIAKLNVSLVATSYSTAVRCRFRVPVLDRTCPHM